MISDMSGVIFDYAFVFNRPVLTLAGEMKKLGMEAFDLAEEAWELGVLDQLGQQISLSDIDNLTQIIKETLANQSIQQQIEQLKDQHLYAFGCAGDLVAQQLIDIHSEIASSEA